MEEIKSAFLPAIIPILNDILFKVNGGSDSTFIGCILKNVAYRPEWHDTHSQIRRVGGQKAFIDAVSRICPKFGELEKYPPTRGGLTRSVFRADPLVAVCTIRAWFKAETSSCTCKTLMGIVFHVLLPLSTTTAPKEFIVFSGNAFSANQYLDIDTTVVRGKKGTPMHATKSVRYWLVDWMPDTTPVLIGRKDIDAFGIGLNVRDISTHEHHRQRLQKVLLTLLQREGVRSPCLYSADADPKSEGANEDSAKHRHSSTVLTLRTIGSKVKQITSMEWASLLGPELMTRRHVI
ncbi:hypothetical protein ADUPG1_008863 [Aduncisulcus paluster]|uniref:Uncharacterized protein n=1 Tax=Aduncisulcus paluster TaxID=2918883 RepID=A0ABQ5KVS6_9EUKA|nr:hypothetical protein ADUPG1_008863 [Aduncisulcus paluster]